MPTLAPRDCEDELRRWGRDYGRSVADDLKDRCSSWFFLVKRCHDEDRPFGEVLNWTHRIRKSYDNAFTIRRSHDTRAAILRLKAERLRPEFTVLANEWRRDTQHLSLMAKKVTHPAYFRIIGMGEGVIPLLLEALRDDPAHWFAALRATTNVDPSPTEGNPSSVRQAWLAWGQDSGLIDRL